MLRNKKGSGGGLPVTPFQERWAEWLTLILFVLALILSLMIGSAFMAYIIALLVGFASGRYLQFRRWRFPYLLMIVGLVVGYTIGSRYGDRKVVLFLFLVGLIISKWLHEQGKIK